MCFHSMEGVVSSDQMHDRLYRALEEGFVVLLWEQDWLRRLVRQLPCAKGTDGTVRELRLLDEDFGDPGVLSRLDQEHFVVVFNTGAPEYQRAFGREETKFSYLTGLIGRELLAPLSHTDYKDATEFIDDLLRFQVSYPRLDK